jgi:hypothetical protein
MSCRPPTEVSTPFDAWSTAVATGAALLRLPVVRVLTDGTYVSAVVNPTIRGARRERILGGPPAPARISTRTRPTWCG